MRQIIRRFGVRLNRAQQLLWGASAACILLAGLVGAADPLSVAASLIGVTSLVFAAVGALLGPLLMIVFSVLYGIISFDMAYYGEMITYLGMTAPMSVMALVTWARHPADADSAQVRVAKTRRRDWLTLGITACAITYAFYFMLRALGTASLVLSTLSVATSYAAAYLTWRRSPAYALAYAANDVVLIVLWCGPLQTDPQYTSVVICFAVFLVNDLYGFFSWRKMQDHQERHSRRLRS